MHEEFASFLPNKLIKSPFSLQMMGISYCNEGYEIFRRKSNIACIEYIMEGKGTVETCGKIFHPKKGDVYILHINDDQHYYSDLKEPWTKIWINVKGTLIENLLYLYGLSEVYHIENMDVLSDFMEMWELTNRKDMEQDILLDEIALILHRMIQKMSKQNSSLHLKIPEEALSLKNYLDKSIEKNITSQMMADYLCLSTSQTIRIFKKAFQLTPYDYLMRQRIELAKILLANSSLKIWEVAEKSGFHDERYFSRYFRQQTGIAPREYRRSIVGG